MRLPLVSLRTASNWQKLTHIGDSGCEDIWEIGRLTFRSLYYIRRHARIRKEHMKSRQFSTIAAQYY